MLDLADFALQEQPEHSLMVAISRAWYNGSYTMAAKPIKSLEMHYTMIQFLIIGNIKTTVQNRSTHIKMTDVFFQSVTQAYSEIETPSSPNRSRTYELPITTVNRVSSLSGCW